VPNGGRVLIPDISTAVHRDLIIALATRHRLPAVFLGRGWRGLVDSFRQAASYVDRILRGDKPADFPVQAPTKFELVVNLKTAKALGIDVPRIGPPRRFSNPQVSLSHTREGVHCS